MNVKFVAIWLLQCKRKMVVEVQQVLPITIYNNWNNYKMKARDEKKYRP